MSTIDVSWRCRQDIPAFLYLDIKAGMFPVLTKRDYTRLIHTGSIVGFSARSKENLIGYLFYECHYDKFSILRMVVDPDYRRKGVGTTLIHRLKSKLNPKKRRVIEMLIDETNIDGQFFLSDNEFRATAVVRQFFEDGKDAYLMRYTMD